MFPKPLGIRMFRTALPKLDPATRLRRYRLFIFAVTFLAYLCFHMTRRPIAVVKPVLNYNGSCYQAAPLVNLTVTTQNARTWCNWEPFGTHPQYLGYLDFVYLFSYAVCMFVSGFVAERMHLRYFLSLGMLLSGLTTYLFGLGHTMNYHTLWFYLAVQLVAGGVQSAGWPAVVTIMSNWFGKAKRGLIFGIWNAHTSVGNIVGAFIASAFVEIDWAYSFYVPGLICCAFGLFVFLFVPTSPENVGLNDGAISAEVGPTSTASDADNNEPLNTVLGSESLSNKRNINSAVADTSENMNLINNADQIRKDAISFFRALAIPGVLEFSLALFFAKLVSYTYWFLLPLYVNSSTSFSAEFAAKISTVFDVGGIAGGILAGWFSDRTGASAATSVGFFATSIPAIIIYQKYGSMSPVTNIVLLTLIGFLINGPYALITTAVSAELGNHPSVSTGNNAMATVTAIIDGTGSVGAALGPFFAALLKDVGYNWMGVFLMIILSELLALILLLRTAVKEILRLRRREDPASTL